jgi:hypothetical protein
MKKSFLKQVWVALKIWVIALAVNTLLGSLYITGGLERGIMTAGIVFGSIFSFPIFCILLIVINHCVSRRKDGLELFRYVFISALLLTLFSSMLFFLQMGGGVPVGLMVISLVSAIAGVTAQYSSLFTLTDYDKKLEKFLL